MDPDKQDVRILSKMDRFDFGDLQASLSGGAYGLKRVGRVALYKFEFGSLDLVQLLLDLV